MGGVAAVDRALAVVKALVVAGRPLSLSEVAEASGLYKSAVLRLMVSLEKASLVVRRRDQSYILGHFALLAGRAYEASTHIEEHLQPILQELVAQGTESPSFHVRADAQRRLCLLRLDSQHATLDRVRAGDYLPLDRGAAGRVLRQETGAAGGAPALVAVSFGERDPSCAAVAGPVYGPGQELLGSLSLSGPLERFTEASIRTMTPVLLAACRRATLALGGTWPEAGA